jgi:hypothetical protein
VTDETNRRDSTSQYGGLFTQSMGLATLHANPSLTVVWWNYESPKNFRKGFDRDLVSELKARGIVVEASKVRLQPSPGVVLTSNNIGELGSRATAEY